MAPLWCQLLVAAARTGRPAGIDVNAPRCSPSPRSVGRPSTRWKHPPRRQSGRARPRAALHQRVLTCRISTPTAMETLTKHFESRVGASLERTGVKPSTFGLQAVGDLNPVRQLRPGRPPRLAMACQVPVFIEACRRAHVAPVPSPGATRPGILHRTERRQTDDESNGTGHGRARARPEVTASAGPHGAGAEHDLCAGGPTGAFPNRSG